MALAVCQKKMVTACAALVAQFVSACNDGLRVSASIDRELLMLHNDVAHTVPHYVR